MRQIVRTIIVLGFAALIIGAALIVSSYIHFSKTTSEPYTTQESTVAFKEQGFEVSPDNPVTHVLQFNEGDNIDIQLGVFGLGEIIRFVVSAGSVELINYEGAQGLERNFTAPLTANYTFTFSKPYITHNIFTQDVVSLDMTVTVSKTISGYRDSVENYPFVPFWASYVGAGFVVSGIAGLVFGIARKGKTQKTLEDYPK